MSVLGLVLTFKLCKELNFKRIPINDYNSRFILELHVFEQSQWP